MGSSSSPGGETKYTWNDEMKPRWISTLTNAERAIDRPFAKFPGGADSRFADLTYNQLAAIENAGTLMQGAPNPNNSANAAADQVQGTLGGRYMGQSPHGIQENGYDAFNPWTHGNHPNRYASMGNEFGGMSSPHFRTLMNQGMEDIAGNYQRGTSADTTRMFNLAGAFGGSAHQNAVQNNEAALAKQLGNYAAGMQNQQYDRSAGLEEGRIGRMYGADESAINRGNEGWQRAADRDFQGFQNERQRQMGAVGLGQNETGLGIDRLNMALQTGGLAQQQNQRDYDFNYQNWADEQNHSFKMLDFLTNIYGRAQGGGSMNQAIYGGGGNQAGNVLGGLLGAYALSQ